MGAAEDSELRIADFLQCHMRVDNLDKEQDIFASGFANSLFALQLVTFVEQTFGIRVEEDDLDLDNFRSVSAIDRFVKRKV